MIRLGKTELQVSEIGLGTVELGIPAYGVKTPDEQVKTQSDAISFLHKAIDFGVNFFDTAAAYGCSEEILGKAFADRRHKVIIASKCRQIDEKLSDNDIYTSLMSDTYSSLKQLGTDFVDIMQLHNPTKNLFNNNGFIKFALDGKKTDLFKFVGASVYGVDDALAAVSSPVIDVVQVAYNIFDRRMEAEVFPKASELDKGIVIRSVFLRGALTPRIRYFTKPGEIFVKQHVNNLVDEFGCLLEDLPKICTAFVLTKKPGLILIGTANENELTEALSAVSYSFTSDQFDILNRYSTSNLQIIEPFRWD